MNTITHCKGLPEILQLDVYLHSTAILIAYQQGIRYWYLYTVQCAVVFLQYLIFAPLSGSITESHGVSLVGQHLLF